MDRPDEVPEMSKPFPYRVEFSKKPFGRIQSRKFRTKDEAFRFVSWLEDEGIQWHQVWGPDCDGDTWNGHSRA
jgi:hypothetical protein